MKLYDIPTESKIRVLLAKRTNKRAVKSAIITFHHLDGMYSYCTTEDGKLVHLSAATPLTLGKDGIYEIQ